MKNRTGVISWGNVFFFGAAIVLFVIAFHYLTDIKLVAHMFRSVRVGWLSVAILAQAATYLCTAIAYERGLRMCEAPPVPLGALFTASVVALFVNQAIPSGEMSGGVFLSDFLAKRGTPLRRAFSVFFIELLAFYVAAITLIVIVALVCFFVHVPEFVLPILGGGLLVYVFFFTIITLIGKGKFLSRIIRRLQTISFFKKYVDNLHTIQEEAHTDNVHHPLQLLLHKKKSSLEAVLAQIGVFVADALTVYALFAGLDGKVSFFVIFCVMVLTKIVAVVPIAPGALILFESSMVFFLVSFGVGTSVALVVTLLYRALSFWLPMPIGLFLYRRMRKNNRASNQHLAIRHV
ncbi:MAG TPA: lysylphosphatidylglycerol synthase transmembrane domain-containing protein [Candidatus Paceibacterota bacterium]|nr:lysylphosphatidylglycerol synthase transmembrane domain-containing protein [Candidatus Paceibacterota bacterium]